MQSESVTESVCNEEFDRTHSLNEIPDRNKIFFRK